MCYKNETIGIHICVHVTKECVTTEDFTVTDVPADGNCFLVQLHINYNIKQMLLQQRQHFDIMLYTI